MFHAARNDERLHVQTQQPLFRLPRTFTINFRCRSKPRGERHSLFSISKKIFSFIVLSPLLSPLQTPWRSFVEIWKNQPGARDQAKRKRQEREEEKRPFSRLGSTIDQGPSFLVFLSRRGNDCFIAIGGRTIEIWGFAFSRRKIGSILARDRVLSLESGQCRLLFVRKTPLSRVSLFHEFQYRVNWPPASTGSRSFLGSCYTLVDDKRAKCVITPNVSSQPRLITGQHATNDP